MRKRAFLGLLGGVAAWPLAARAQQAAAPVIGILDAVGSEAVSDFRSGLNNAGYFEGRNAIFELRSTTDYAQLPSMAADLVGRKVSVIAAIGGPSAPAAKVATSAIPIVFSIGGDPVELGLVDSLSHPGGNITGATFFTAHLLQKQADLLHDLLPKLKILGVLVNSENARAEADTRNVRLAAAHFGFEVTVLRANPRSDFDAVFANFVASRTDALVIAGDPFFLRASTALAAAAARHAIPSIFGSRAFAHAGGLMYYGTSLSEAHRQAGIYAGRILGGDKPENLPVVQPTKFELVINLKTAKALGLEIPQTLLARADEVIE